MRGTPILKFIRQLYIYKYKNLINTVGEKNIINVSIVLHCVFCIVLLYVLFKSKVIYIFIF